MTTCPNESTLLYSPTGIWQHQYGTKKLNNVMNVKVLSIQEWRQQGPLKWRYPTATLYTGSQPRRPWLKGTL